MKEGRGIRVKEMGTGVKERGYWGDGGGIRVKEMGYWGEGEGCTGVGDGRVELKGKRALPG